VALNDPQLVGNVVRGLVALGFMMLAAGGAARLCHSRTSWSIAATVFLLVFVWLLLGVVPHPHQAGLLYALEWGVFGAGVYAIVRAHRAPPADEDEAVDDPERLLAFWFGDDLSTADAVAGRSATWFRADPDFDRAIRERFGDWPDRALAGELDHWLKSARGTLALVLVLDQLPRNLHRGTPRAFAYDARALEVAEDALRRGVDDVLHPVEAAFVYMPLEHAEDRALQDRCVELFTQLAASCPIEFADQLAEYRNYAERHRDVVKRFGRFPHRNAILGREPTPEEEAWLAEGGERF